MNTLVLANHKGGVGKSAVATLLAHYFASRGLRVLAIDLDHQGNLSRPLERSTRATLATVTADLLMTTLVSAVPDARLVLVPSSRSLIGLERQPALHTPFARNLRGFLCAASDRFDVCVIDTNPNPGHPADCCIDLSRPCAVTDPNFGSGGRSPVATVWVEGSERIVSRAAVAHFVARIAAEGRPTPTCESLRHV